MKVFIDNAPSFYRINLLNEMIKRIDVGIVYTKRVDFDKSRNTDFYGGETNFESTFLKENPFLMVFQICNYIKKHDIDEAIIGGWGCFGAWLFLLFLPHKKISCVIESSIYESQTSGIKGIIKKIFLKKCSKVYAAGKPQARLAKALGFNGEIKITGGCGLLNYIKQPDYVPRETVRNFLYVGRFVEVKNLRLLVETFNKLPHLKLMMAGYGELEPDLKNLAKENIKFLGPVKNCDLWKIYRKADVFILPSISETWGLVVEEALNNGLPVIVSDKVGCREDLVTSETGIVFLHNSHESLLSSINEMTDIDAYNKLRMNISKLNFIERASHQVEVFL